MLSCLQITFDNLDVPVKHRNTKLLYALALYADQHMCVYGEPIGKHERLGSEYLTMLRGYRKMLNLQTAEGREWLSALNKLHKAAGFNTEISN